MRIALIGIAFLALVGCGLVDGDNRPKGPDGRWRHDNTDPDIMVASTIEIKGSHYSRGIVLLSGPNRGVHTNLGSGSVERSGDTLFLKLEKNYNGEPIDCNNPDDFMPCPTQVFEFSRNQIAHVANAWEDTIKVHDSPQIYKRVD